MRKIILLIIVIILCFALMLVVIPSRAAKIYGPPAHWLTFAQRFEYSAKLIWHDGLLTNPPNTNGNQQPFPIDSGESVNSIATRLEQNGLIRDARAFLDYVIYTGLDVSIQAGSYQLSPAMSAIDIARELQDATSEEVTFVILPGWRMEEIAASLPTSGLPITTDEFLSLAQTATTKFDFLSEQAPVEGFLFPDSYILSRTTSAEKVLDEFLRNFALHLTSAIKNGIEAQGLTVHEAVILASIVQREAVQPEESPLIASVYLNRLRAGMKLEADPTVQYSIGYNAAQGTWWTNPLSALDLQYDSPFNTYLYTGLPSSSISNPGSQALTAVAFPAETPYFFFRARCDGSGYHFFAVTFEEHVNNGCQ